MASPTASSLAEKNPTPSGVSSSFYISTPFSEFDLFHNPTV
jgi:hypothetical protein